MSGAEFHGYSMELVANKLMNFKKTLKRTLAAGLAAVTMAGMITPVFAEGVLDLGATKPTIKITNRYSGQDDDTRAIYGAEFKVKKTGSYDKNTGEIKNLEPSTDAGVLNISSNGDGSNKKTEATLNLDDFGRYEIYQTKRAPGTLANTQKLKDSNKKEVPNDKNFLQAVLEFPLMTTDGKLNSNQTFVLHPKYDVATKDITVNKKGNDGSTGLDGVGFQLTYLSDKLDIAFENYQKIKGIENLETAFNGINAIKGTTKDGKVTFTDLPVGLYKLEETTTPAGYQKATHPMYFAIYSTEPLATSKNDFKVVAFTSSNIDDIEKEYRASVDAEDIESTTLDSKFTEIRNALATSRLTGENTDITLTNYKLPEIKKESVKDGEVTKAGETLNVKPGVPFQYRITSTLPGDIETYTKYVFTDELDTRLDYKGNPTVKADGTTLTEKTHYTVTAPQGTNGGTLTVTLTEAGIKALQGKTNLVLEFDAAINSTAVSNEDVTNGATLTFRNIFNEDGKGDTVTTPPDETKVKTFKGTVEFTKINGSDQKPLAGATFRLYTKNALGAENEYKDPLTNKVVDVTSGTDGKVTFENLAEGTYYIREIKAPDNHKLAQAFYKLTVGNDGKNITYTISNGITAGNFSGDAQTGYMFSNYSTNSLMPDTGTRGLIPYALIATVMAGAGYAVLKKKRVEE